MSTIGYESYPAEDWRVWEEIHNHPRSDRQIYPRGICMGCDLYQDTYGDYIGNPRLQFDPNKPDNKRKFLFATYIPSRSPEFKVHANRGHALNAMSNWPTDSLLFEWDATSSRWNEIVRHDGWKRSKACDNCGVALGDSYSRGNIRWTKPPYPPVLQTLCYNCTR